MQGQKTLTKPERRFVYKSKYRSNLEVSCSFRVHPPNSRLFAVYNLFEIQNSIPFWKTPSGIATVNHQMQTNTWKLNLKICKMSNYTESLRENIRPSVTGRGAYF